MVYIKKILFLALAGALLFTGCSHKEDVQKNDGGALSEEAVVVTEVSLSEVKDEIKKTIGATDALDFNDNAVEMLYSIKKEDVKQFAGFSVAQGTFPHEIVMIEAANEEAGQRIEKAFEAKISSFAEQSKNYDAENYALAKKCKVQKNGNYFAMFLSPDYEDILGIYEKHVK